jgi:hypothetical protein
LRKLASRTTTGVAIPYRRLLVFSRGWYNQGLAVQARHSGDTSLNKEGKPAMARHGLASSC